MKILWSLLAHASYEDIRATIYEHFGNKAALDYTVAVDDAVKLVAEFPNVGKQELELDPNGSVRSFSVRKLTKLIYFVEDDVLYIADVWATRQDPNILASRFEK